MVEAIDILWRRRKKKKKGCLPVICSEIPRQCAYRIGRKQRVKDRNEGSRSTSRPIAWELRQLNEIRLAKRHEKPDRLKTALYHSAYIFSAKSPRFICFFFYFVSFSFFFNSTLPVVINRTVERSGRAGFHTATAVFLTLFFLINCDNTSNMMWKAYFQRNATFFFFLFKFYV